MWPVSWKVAQKKLQEYKKKNHHDVFNDSEEINLLPIPQTYWQCEQYLQEWDAWIPALLSSPSAIRFRDCSIQEMEAQ